MCPPWHSCHGFTTPISGYLPVPLGFWPLEIRCPVTVQLKRAQERAQESQSRTVSAHYLFFPSLFPSPLASVSSSPFCLLLTPAGTLAPPSNALSVCAPVRKQAEQSRASPSQADSVHSARGRKAWPSLTLKTSRMEQARLRQRPHGPARTLERSTGSVSPIRATGLNRKGVKTWHRTSLPEARHTFSCNLWKKINKMHLNTIVFPYLFGQNPCCQPYSL